MVNCFGADAALGGHVGGGTGGGVAALNVASLDVLTLAGDVVVTLWVVDDLGLDGEILHSLPHPLNWLVLHNGLLNLLGNILNLSFNGIVVSNSPFNGDSLSPCNLFILNNLSFIWNSLNPFNLIIFDVFFLEGDVLDTGLNGDFLSNDFLSKALAEGGVTGSGLEGLVHQFVVLGELAVGGAGLLVEAGARVHV